MEFISETVEILPEETTILPTTKLTTQTTFETTKTVTTTETATETTTEPITTIELTTIGKKKHLQ